MDSTSFILTIIIAIILMGLVVAGLAIGLLITGRSRLRKRCGWTPGKKDEKTTTCPICGDKKICDEEEEKK